MEEILKMKLVSSSIEYEKEEFYEEIEAPKFVDFRVPNHFSPDDRFWFCARVGCDQKHEEEIDHESIDKNFVLRVMAARSPNVRFRRAISRKPISGSKKCPLSAPPKPVKSRLPRLAIVSSSISKKLLNEENGKIRIPCAKVKATSTTPKARVKHVAAKYMTSPRKKKGNSPNANAFRSARNPMKMSVSLPKSKVVAKALVFNSPKKGLKKKVADEFGTPITKLCEGVKKLQINSHQVGVARKLSKDCVREIKKLPMDGSRKVLSSCKEKTREVVAKTSRSVKCKAKSNCRKQGVGEKCGDDSSDMEIDEKSRCGSLESGVLAMKPGTEDQHCSSQEEGTSHSDRPLTGESSGGVSSNSQKCEMSAVQASDSSKEKTTTIEVPEDEQQRKSDSNTASDVENRNPVTEARDNDDEENEKSGLQNESKVSTEENSKQIQEPIVEDKRTDKGNVTASDIENLYPRVVNESEDNEDKENALSIANIRNLNSESLNKHNASVKTKVQAKQTTQKMDKAAKENCHVGTGKQVLKNKKLKTTNPKPFRLRTDERGILKEAIMERKANSTENSSTENENSQVTGNGVTEKANKKQDSRSLKKDQVRIIKSRYKTSKELEPKDKSSQTTQLPFLQNQREIASHVKSRKLRANGETEITMSRPKGAKRQGNEADEPINKASAAQKSGAQGKKTGTIPREPKFHSLHNPKDCTRNKS